MATKDDFTAAEWETLEKGVAGTGLLVSLSDRGFFDSFREAGALARHLVAARQGSSSELVRALAEMHGTTGFGVTTPPEEIESETLAALRASVATLEEKAPAEADAYRAFVVEIGELVASAAGGGEVAESEALGKIRSALAEPA